MTKVLAIILYHLIIVSITLYGYELFHLHLDNIANKKLSQQVSMLRDEIALCRDNNSSITTKIVYWY